MNFVLRSSVSPTYEFDNLSERQVHVGSGECKNRSGDGSSVAAPGQGSNAAFVFRFPPRERTRSGDAPADMSGGCLVSRSRNPGTYVDET